MGILDENVKDLSLSELTRLIAREVSRQVPAIPAGVSALDDQDTPVLHPDVQTDGQVLTYDAAKGYYVPRTPETTSFTPPAAIGNTPTVKGGPGFLAVTWTPNSSDVPVEYEVHVSLSSGFTPDSTTLAGTIAGALAFVRRLPDGTADGLPLTYYDDLSADPLVATVYYAKIVPVGYDGTYFGGSRATAQSGEGSGSMTQVTTDDIVVDAITAEKILAGTITADRLASALLFTNTLYVPTNDSGTQRVEIKTSGIFLYDASGNELVVIPTDSGRDPSFTGNVVTGGLTVTGNMQIQGLTNAMQKGSQLTLNAAFADPTTAPTLGFQYETHFPDGQYFAQFGIDYDSSGSDGVTPSYWMILWDTSNVYKIVEVKASDYTVIQSKTLFSVGSGTPWGIARVGDYVCCVFTNNSGVLNNRTFLASDIQAGSVATTNIGTSMSGTLVRGIGVGADGSKLLVSNWNSTSTGAVARVTRFTISLGATALDTAWTMTGGVTKPAGTGNSMKGVTGRKASTHTIHIEDVDNDSVSTYQEYDSTTHAASTADGNAWMPNAVQSTGNTLFQLNGITHDGTNYWGGFSQGGIVKYTNWVWAAGNESDIWYFGYTWLDDAANSATPANGGDVLAATSISNASPAVVTASAAHGLSAGDEVRFTTTGTLPTGLTVGTHYYVIAAGLTSTQFEVSATRGGSAINTSGAGSGTHSINYVRETKISALSNRKLNGASTTIGVSGVSTDVAMRGQMLVTSANLPSGTTDTRVYMLPKSTAPTTTNMLKQAPFAHSSTSTTYTQYINVNTAGTVYRDVNDFLTGTSNIVGSSSGITAAWNLGGNGLFRLPSITIAQRLASPTAADIVYDPTYKYPQYYDGAGYREVSPEDNYLRTVEELERLGAANGSTVIYPKVMNFMPSGGSSSVIAYTTRRLTGVCFMVRKTITATGIAIRCTAAGSGTQNFSSVGLYSMSSTGGWTFIIDSGASSVHAAMQAQGINKMAFSATQTLVPGTVYIMAILAGFTTGAMTVEGVASTPLDLSNNNGFLWCTGVDAVTSRQNASIAAATLDANGFTSVPWMCVY